MRSFSLYVSVIFIVLFQLSCDLAIENDAEITAVIPETAVFGTLLQNEDELAALSNSQLLKLINLRSSISVDSLIKNETFSKLKFTNLSISWHSVRKGELAPLIIIETEDGPDLIVSDLTSVFGITSESEVRDYDGYQINRFTTERGSFVYSSTDNLLAISFTEVLIEDFIRAVANEDSRLALGNKNESFYVNNARLDEVFDKTDFFNFEFLTQGVTQLDLSESEGLIEFRGLTNSNSDQNSYNAAIFAQSYIPSEHQFIKWSNAGLGNNENLVEVGLSVYGENQSVYLFKQEDIQSYKQELTRLAKEKLAESDSLPYQESFAGADILYIKGGYFSNLLGKNELDKGAYSAVIDQMVLVSLSDEGIRQCLASHADETTMGQLVNERLFIERLIQDTYFTQIINSIDKSDYSQLVLQANVVNSGMLVNGTLKLSNSREGVNNELGQTTVLKANAFLDSEAQTRAHVLINHNSREREVVAQDDKNSLYQISLEGEINWKVELAAEIKSSIIQVDYFNNGKLQYLFATDSLIHLIDRNGELVEGFPKAHGIEGDIAQLVLIDYDKTKRYRYMVESSRGKLYLFDKEVNMLNGWAPLDLKAVLLNSPFHARISGKDFYPIAERSNKIHLINRRGKEYPGFPKDLDMRFSGDLYLDRQPSFGSSKVWVISDQGKLRSVNLLGKVANQEQLVRPNNETSFRLLTDELGSGFLIARSDDKQTAILDRDQNELFSIPSTISPDDELKFYRFGNGGEVILRWNKRDTQVIVYDLQGRTLASGIESGFQPSLLYFQNTDTYQLFVNLANEVNIYEFASSTE